MVEQNYRRVVMVELGGEQERRPAARERRQVRGIV